MTKKNYSITTTVFTVFLCCLLQSIPVVASQADLDQEVDGLISFFKNNPRGSKILGQKIKFSGISDPRFFDLVEKELITGLEQNNKKYRAEDYAWFVQLLAFSGQEKYSATLAKIPTLTKSRKIKRHAASSLGVIRDFARWNPVISNGLENTPKDRIKKQRVINMLTAQDLELKRAGFSLVDTLYSHDEEMLGIVEKWLTDNYLYAKASDDMGEAAAWACRVLGSSGNTNYIPLLEKVQTSQPAGAVERWAKKSLRKLKKYR